MNAATRRYLNAMRLANGTKTAKTLAAELDLVPIQVRVMAAEHNIPLLTETQDENVIFSSNQAPS